MFSQPPQPYPVGEETLQPAMHAPLRGEGDVSALSGTSRVNNIPAVLLDDAPQSSRLSLWWAQGRESSDALGPSLTLRMTSDGHGAKRASVFQLCPLQCTPFPFIPNGRQAQS